MSNEDKVKKQCLLGRTPDEHMHCNPAAFRDYDRICQDAALLLERAIGDWNK